jgi:tetratricopeptide (TPR) repeat protein
MAKTKVTRTYGPIHFEDLDPHRFEDLVRELIYDYKYWQSIEATGRSGSDEGFDIRAYEKVEITSRGENENGEEGEEVHPMEGNLWMIQGKREKEIGPKRVKAILAEVDSKNPPYGYILAASANFSKESYDVFREELRNKGVMEFYLWGSAQLEDMLHLPKNDRILFTFFGISLVSKRRSLSTEIRSIVNTKNKLYKVLGEAQQEIHKSVLIRDLKDRNYPYKKEYIDFQKKPRWKEYIAFDHHPHGLCCHNYEHFAYVDDVWHDKGDQDKAIADFNKAIQLNPNDAVAYSNRGLAWNKKGDQDKAIADFNKAIQLNPNFSIAYNYRGIALYKKGYLDKAIADFNKAIQLNPNDAVAYNHRGLAWYKKGDLDKAIADFNKAIQLNPNYTDAYNNRKNAQRKGQPDANQ